MALRVFMIPRTCVANRVTRSRKHSNGPVPVSSSLSGNAPSTSSRLMEWLDTNRVGELNVDVRSVDVNGRTLDRTVACKDLSPGDVAFSIPSNLVVTLDRVFKDDTLAELLTTDKLSELACLALYMMYEKKNGENSFWYSYIKELDRLRARGQQGSESPVLWPPGEADRLLSGSPVLDELKERIEGIDKQFEECDTVWYLAGSLFNAYPFDIPTECFTKKTFRQAFAAVQASVVHLQNVPLSRRFALVPLGPPLLTYSSESKALIKTNDDGTLVQLAVDREYSAGDPVFAWCGPQPNKRLLINYGIVDEDNPYDFLQIIASLQQSDPLFQTKRKLLLQHGFAAQKQVFRLQRSGQIPTELLSFLRVAYVNSEGMLTQINFKDPTQSDPILDGVIYGQLLSYLELRLNRYKNSIEVDVETINDPNASAREKVSAKLLKCEKEILQQAIDDILHRTNAADREDFPVGQHNAPVQLI